MSIYRFFGGYFKAYISGRRTERFLNMIIKRKIFVWNVIKIDESTIEFFVSKKGFKVIETMAEENGINLKILSTYGLSEQMKKMKTRWMFVSFLPVGVTLFFLLSSVIWSIDIPEADFADKDALKNTLAQMGLHEGSIKYNIDYRHVENVLVTKHEDIIWADVELKGTKLVVTVKPRTKAPESVAKDEPCNLVANKDGYILKVIAENGDKIAKPGDTVLKGQVLISGIVQSEKVGGRYVHSQGEVFARTWTEKKANQKLYVYEKNYTGKSKKNLEIDLGNIKIPIYFKKNIDFYNYDSIIKESNIFFMKIKKTSYNEYTLHKKKLSQDNAVKMCSDKLLDEIKKETQNIKTKKVTYEKTDDETVSVRVFVQSEENIAQPEKIITDKTVR